MMHVQGMQGFGFLSMDPQLNLGINNECTWAIPEVTWEEA